MTHPFILNQLGEILISQKIVNREDIDSALESDDGLLGDRLIKNNVIDEKQLAEALAIQFHLQYVSLEDFIVKKELFNVLSAAHAYQLNVVPYRYLKGVLQVAITNPLDLFLVEKLENITKAKIEFVISTPTDIKISLARSEGKSEILKDVSQNFKIEIVKETERGEETVDLSNSEDADLAPVVHLVNTIVMAAMQKRASDIHIETYEHGIVVKYRVDGVLYSAMEVLDQKYHSALVSRIKVMAELDISEQRVPQDGRFKLRINNRDVDFRISILPSVHGEDIVIRVLDKSTMSDSVEQLDIGSLNLQPDVLKKFRRAVNEPYGMVLITGPTGSGKTTTLYAALSELNDGQEKIITIEDPVEYQLDGIVQIPVNEKKGLTFAKGLRSILRHDPDKIMVGEIRDVETAQIAIQSALTGHVVFTTVHANNSIDVISRFSHMGINVHSFSSSLNCVMAQRLVRKICNSCKEESHVNDILLERSGLEVEKYRDHVWYVGKGCSHCGHSGYLGRVIIAEFLVLTTKMRDMISDKCSTSELYEQAVYEGMVTLRQDALQKAIRGETTLSEINRVTFVE